ncbi:class I SAM-dependent methyltransferase [Rhizobium sp. 2YAF20]|uniref:class I SAM-dependent methyltransferase n=1 Tax=Rhizobium sp. 2YAF20 TaxID=3233027 RepID=UPI003F9DE59F
MDRDDQTLRFYAQEAAVYTSRGRKPSQRRIEAFLSMLPAAATILELGCGAGQDSEFMIAKGFNVHPTDGTPEIAQAAEKRLGRPVATLLFGDLDEDGIFDGIWANACLLHVPRADLSGILARINTALKKGGVFYASFKAGDADGRDQFDRYYNYPSESWLRGIYAAFPWESVSIEAGRGSGYDQKPTDWLHVTAISRI